MVVCPFCGAPETDRLDIEGHRFLVFRCMFTPEVDPSLDDKTIAKLLAESYSKLGPQFFRAQCDRLHLVVTGGGASTRSPH